MADELECQARLDPLPIALSPHHHAEPVAVAVPAMPGMKREAAQPVKDRLAAVDFDRQRIMRPVADHHVGAGIDRRMADLGHVLQHFACRRPNDTRR